MSLTLWAGAKHPEHARMIKILVAAAFANVPLEYKECTFGVENETEEYATKCSPCMRFPCLQVGETFVFESNAILRHIARLDKSGLKLYGNDALESSQVDMWLDFAATEIDSANRPYLMEVFRNIPAPKEALGGVEEVLCGLERWAKSRKFLVGDHVTIADIAVAFSLQWVYRCNKTHGAELAKKFPSVYRLYTTVMELPKTAEVLKSLGASVGPITA